MKNIFRSLIVPGMIVCSAVSVAASDGTHFEKIRLRLDIAKIKDPALKKMVAGAENNVADTIGALSHGALRNEEIAKKIGWAGNERLLLAPDSSCANGVGLITPDGRAITREAYAFMGGSAWKKEGEHAFSFLAEYKDPVIQENVVTHRYFFEQVGDHWRLSKQEVVGKHITDEKC